MGAGHTGTSGRFGRVADQAFELAFLVDQVNKYRAAEKAEADRKAEEAKSTLERVRDGLGL
jgi:hypothetical protein